MKYAIVEKGGKQYKVSEGDVVQVDKVPDEVGKKFTFDSVLLFADDGEIQIGTPKVKGASVKATVLGHPKGKKIVVFKYRPKQRYRVKTGHRQSYTQLKIESIKRSK